MKGLDEATLALARRERGLDLPILAVAVDTRSLQLICQPRMDCDSMLQKDFNKGFFE